MSSVSHLFQTRETENFSLLGKNTAAYRMMNSTRYTPCWNSTNQHDNTFNIDSNRVPKNSVEETIIVSILLGCIIVFTIVGNTTVLMAVYLDRRLRHTTNYFIVNLAAADLLLGVTVLPLSATLEVLKYWPFGEILCELWASADVLWCTASILTLCVISIDRYIGVTRPLRHSSIITSRRAALIIVFIWVLSGVISVGPLIGWRESGGNQTYECTVTKQIGYVIFSVSGSFYIPSFIIFVVYIKIYREASKHTKFLSSGSKTIKTGEDNGMILRIHTARFSQAGIPPYHGSSSSDNSEGSLRKLSSRITPAGKLAKFKREKKAAKTLGIVVGVFICCWFPFFFCLPLDVLCDSCHVPDKLFTVIFWLGYCNSLMNPIIYASSSRDFKRAFLKVLRCHWIRKCHNINGDYINRDFKTRKLSCYVSKEYGSDSATVHVQKKNSCSASLKPGSPVKSLLVFQDRRKLSSPSSNLDKSSFSDLADEEYNIIQLQDLDSVPRKYSAIV